MLSSSDLPPDVEARISGLEEAVIRLGQLVEHIYSSPGLGLAEAKAAVEAMARNS